MIKKTARGRKSRKIPADQSDPTGRAPIMSVYKHLPRQKKAGTRCTRCTEASEDMEIISSRLENIEKIIKEFNQLMKN